MTLDEWKAQQTASRDKPTFNVRKAGEGSDIDPKWKKTYAYKKEKETHEDDDEEVRKKCQITVWKFQFFLPHIFYVKSILANSRVSKAGISDNFRCSEF